MRQADQTGSKVSSKTDLPDSALAPIRWPLRLTLAGLWAERLARAFWPLWSLILGLVAVLSFRLQDLLGLDAFWTLSVAACAALLGLAWRGWRSFERPRLRDALIRLDRQFPDRPLSALGDRLALGQGTASSDAIWQAHLQRMAAKARDARPIEPDLRLASRDPYGLRHMALIAFAMALLFGSLGQVVGLNAPLAGPNPALAAQGPTWEGWASPPAYTGKPSLYLNEQTAEVLSLPKGTRIRLRLYGEPGSLIVSETVSARSDPPPASDPAQELLVVQSGRLEIEGAGGRAWDIAIIPDAAPTIAADGAVKRKGDGRFVQGFVASDDYGVVKGQAVLALDLTRVDRRHGLAIDPETLPRITLDLPLPRRGKSPEIKGKLVDDLSKSLLANLPVTLTFAASDAAGQRSEAAPFAMTLPGKRFFDPMAAALIEMRRDLLWNPANARRSVQILRALTWQAEGRLGPAPAEKRLRLAIRRLEADQASLTPETRDQIAEELWQLALLLEEGDLSSAKERLDRAMKRLEEAIRRGADPAEVQELMKEMQKAQDDYLRMLAEEKKKEGREDKIDEGQNGPTITHDQLQEMLDRLQKLMQEGKTAEAAELMAQIRQLMESLELTDGPGGKGGPGGEAMKGLGDQIRRQQKLSDDAFRQLNGQETPPEQGEGGQDQGETGQEQGEGQHGDQGQDGTEPGDQGKSLAERQAEIRREIERLRDSGDLPGEDSQDGESGREKLGEAGRSMDEAEEALRQGDLNGALDRQAEALDALREGLRNFGRAAEEEQRRASDPDSPNADQTSDQRGASRDPLGRAGDDIVTNGSDGNLNLGQDARRKADELLDEIRRRAGDQGRAEGERSYLRRLLELF